MELTSREIKTLCISEGAEVAGIASVERFKTAGPGDRPEDKFGKCRSVIVMGTVLPRRLLVMDAGEYTRSRMDASAELENISKRVEARLMVNGYDAKAVCVHNERRGEPGFWDHISMKRAADYAGLGRMTRNHHLTSPRYGNMLWFAAVLTDGDFIPDEVISEKICGGCNLCVVACPAGALNDPERLNQKECDKFRCGIIDGEFSIICYECRRACPMRFGRIAGTGGHGHGIRSAGNEQRNHCDMVVHP